MTTDEGEQDPAEQADLEDQQRAERRHGHAGAEGS
jgi:hypothetical protein